MRVVLGDSSPASLESARAFLSRALAPEHFARLTLRQLDVTDEHAVGLQALEADVVASCVPYFLNLPLCRAAIAAKASFLDLGGNTDIVRQELALDAGARSLGLSLDAFCKDIGFLSHGTTVGTNTIIQKKGARVGLITTRGHEDAIHIMRGSRGYSGRDIRKVVHFPETSKPVPIVPKRLIRGISERVDCFGEVVV